MKKFDTTLTSHEAWSGVAKVSDGYKQGSSVLHESGIFIITAGHVVEDFHLSGGSVDFGTDTREIIGYGKHPGYAITDSGMYHDIGLFVLDRAAPRDAQRYELYREHDEAGQQVDLTGYGGSSFWSGSNTVAGLAGEYVTHGSVYHQLAFKRDTGDMIAGGDSGGGMFIDSKLAGVHSYTSGDIGVSTRVSTYTHWIDQTTGTVQDPEARSSEPPSRDSVPMEVSEGEGVWFLVELDSPASREVSVDFYTRDGTAEAGYDYIPTEGTLTLAEGDQWARVWVQTLANSNQGERDFSLVLENPEGAKFPEGKEELTAQRVVHDDQVGLAGVTQLEPELFDV
ncbi:Na-Ca exchanger/integrin-beta4 [Desulfonatronospira thiodismutans ASO3-1]|uniref:Na-Ca exchanger/integrin-beta4 n=2 Tax=Desulfonatronospira TaxID=488937 RepID=D6SR39_9BACT|nr:Calx-beta domain-containing protein [Desulfonatronospira thiodismutans]EFI33155.1 Na-Ca exchanger/integrin-beta4 [Desulfonatronospira thiodismutans ASO3-1]